MRCSVPARGGGDIRPAELARAPAGRDSSRSSAAASRRRLRRVAVPPGVGVARQGPLLERVAQARRPGGAGDARGRGHPQGAVGQQLEAPAAGEGLQPVVGAAQAAEVLAAGAAAAVVGDDVVGVGPPGRLGAAGVAAGAVPQPEEPDLRGGGRVPVHRGRRGRAPGSRRRRPGRGSRQPRAASRASSAAVAVASSAPSSSVSATARLPPGGACTPSAPSWASSSRRCAAVIGVPSTLGAELTVQRPPAPTGAQRGQRGQHGDVAGERRAPSRRPAAAPTPRAPRPAAPRSAGRPRRSAPAARPRRSPTTSPPPPPRAAHWPAPTSRRAVGYTRTPARRSASTRRCSANSSSAAIAAAINRRRSRPDDSPAAAGQQRRHHRRDHLVATRRPARRRTPAPATSPAPPATQAACTAGIRSISTQASASTPEANEREQFSTSASSSGRNSDVPGTGEPAPRRRAPGCPAADRRCRAGRRPAPSPAPPRRRRPSPSGPAPAAAPRPSPPPTTPPPAAATPRRPLQQPPDQRTLHRARGRASALLTDRTYVRGTTVLAHCIMASHVRSGRAVPPVRRGVGAAGAGGGSPFGRTPGMPPVGRLPSGKPTSGSPGTPLVITGRPPCAPCRRSAGPGRASPAAAPPAAPARCGTRPARTPAGA